MKVFSAALALLTIPVFSAGPVLATSNTSSVTINSTVQQSCTAFTNNGALTFSPNYDVFSSSAPTGNTSLTTNCTKGASVAFAVDGGANAGSGSVSGARAMTDGSSHYLSYQLYSDSGLTTPWQFTSSGGTPQAQTGQGNTNAEALTLSLYGQIPTGQDVAVSSSSTTQSYSDTVTVSVNY